MKKQKQNIVKNEVLFFLCLLITILFCWIFFIPKTASLLFSQKRDIIWRSFFSSVQAQKQIDPQKYWEFREFYSPGYFAFSSNGLQAKQTQSSKNTIAIPLTNEKDIHPFLMFQGKYLESLDSLMTNNNLQLSPSRHIEKKAILFQDKNTIIYKADKKTVKIAFILPVSEMKKANGFFDYNEKDKKIVENKYWLNQTTITLQ